ncbi:MAG: BamA/TamA family outer membrane protein [bacterium]|nr:BamA/TamA family outer membrane protein [Candidatus Kapabacteria bacterium]
MKNSIFREQVWLGDDVNIVDNDYVREHFGPLKISYILSGNVTGDHRDDFFSPRNGDFVDARLELGTNSAINQWVKAEFEYRRFLPVGDDKTFGFRWHAGAIAPFGPIKLVPLTSRFWAGGSNSLRGWGPREMLVTRPPLSASADIIDTIVAEVLKDGRRLLGGLIVLELMGDLRWRPFNFPAASTLMQQINNLMLIVGVDVGGAFFRDYGEDEATFQSFLKGIGISPSIALGYDTPIGPLRLGFGSAILDPVTYPDKPWITQRKLLFSDWAWFFSIGHAF